MLKGFWELCAAYRYDYRLMDLSKGAVVWIFILAALFVLTIVTLTEWTFPA